MKCFTFGKIKLGKENEVIQSLKKVKEINSAQLILREQDIVAEIEVEKYDDLKSVVLNKVRTVKGLEKTKTYITMSG